MSKIERELVALGAQRELARSVLGNVLPSVASEEYIHKKDLAEKYARLGFGAKAQSVMEAVKKVAPSPDNDFLWVSLNLETVKVNWSSFYGILLEKEKHLFSTWYKALVLVPVGRWIGDVPEELLDFATSVINQFKTLYVATVIQGKYQSYMGIESDFMTKNVLTLDPILLGYTKERLHQGIDHFAVLGVWGDDWHELDLRGLTSKARIE